GGVALRTNFAAIASSADALTPVSTNANLVAPNLASSPKLATAPTTTIRPQASTAFVAAPQPSSSSSASPQLLINPCLSTLALCPFDGVSQDGCATCK